MTALRHDSECGWGMGVCQFTPYNTENFRIIKKISTKGIYNRFSTL